MKRFATALVVAGLLTGPAAGVAAAGPDPDPTAVVGAAVCTVLVTTETKPGSQAWKDGVADCFTVPY